ncbi:MAG: YceH family protein [Desulfobacteraceae bacterium]|nr:YceH family protein [Desulfobacteraceae bacterium]
MDIILDAHEARVIGCLMEKQMATPEYYPLSLNALTNACNQKTNRDPVTNYSEIALEEVLNGLIQKKLVNKSVVGRVPKFEELLVRQRNFVPKEAAIVCELLLRGPQTAGELRSRTQRLFAFDSLESVLETLAQLEEMGLVQRLARLPGHKESRYGHLLSGPIAAEPERLTEPAPPSERIDGQRLERLEQELAAMKEELAALRGQFEIFKKQFE